MEKVLTQSEFDLLSRQVRSDIVEMIHHANMGHPGSSLSAVEFLVALYFRFMRIDPNRPDWKDRDRFVLSKGHASPVLYSVLARRGYFPQRMLSTFRTYKSFLTAYPDMNTPGVDMESGSLGNGLSTGVGMAVSARMHKQDYKVFVMIGDGELQEGLVWEAAMAAAHHKLDNIIAIVDRNKLQINGTVESIMSTAPLAEKWQAFGWNVLSADGHNYSSISDALTQAIAYRGKPTVIISETVKGKGVSFMENNHTWHRKNITDDQLAQALKEIWQKEG